MEHLPAAALGLIVQQSSPADRKRLAVTCSRFRQLCSLETRGVLLSQQDLEDWAEEALSAFQRAQRLALSGVSLGPDCVLALQQTAPQLLHGLKSLQVINPTWLDAGALLQLLSSCPSLTELHIRGSWSCDASDTLPGPAQHCLRQQLHRLSWQRNSNLHTAQLTELLTARGTCVPAGNSSTPSQPPRWCRALSSSTAELSTPTWQHLTALDLTACPKIGDSLSFLALCPALLSLCLHSCFKVTDTTLQELSKAMQHPQDNDCDSASTDAGSSQQGSTDAGAGGDVPAQHTAIPLQQLDLSYTRVKDAGMPHLVAALPALLSLGLKGCNVGDDGLEHLLSLQHLTSLHIKHCHRVTDEGIEGLSSLSRLRSLSYGYTSMPEADAVAAAIARQFRALTALDLLASELTASGLSALSKLPQLEELKLYQAGVTAEGLVMLAGQPAGAALHSLVLYGTGALRDLACLGALPALRQLQLGRLCDLSAPMATAVRELTAVRHLTSLTLERMDDLTVGALQHILRGCAGLQLLRVRGCDGVCQEDMEELAQDAAAVCSSSASVWWAAAPSCDTDDEEEGWEMLQP